MVLLPSVNLLHASGQHERKELWLGFYLKYITVLTFLALIVISAVGEQVLALLLGPGFSEVTTNLIIISISLLPLNLVRLGIITSVVGDKLKETFLMSSVGMTGFIICAALLTPEMGAKGVSISVVVSAFSSAAFAYWYLRLSSIIKFASFVKIVIMGSAFLGFVVFGGYPRLEAGTAAIIVFILLLLALRIVRVSELVAMIVDKKSVDKAT
jgi:O-antigen/teichoic acid export membrane protein